APAGSTPGEQLLLDENALAAGHDYFAVGDLTVSEDHKVLAFTTDVTGAERYELRFRDIASGTDHDDVVPDVYYGLAWANAHRPFSSPRPKEPTRPGRVWQHLHGPPPRDGPLLFEEVADRFYAPGGPTPPGRSLVITPASKTTTEVWLVDAD